MDALEAFQNEKLQELLENADWITEQVDKTMVAMQEENDGFANNKWLSDDVELMDHQVVGVNWLQAMHTRGLNGILADEMGLGKTLQVLAFFGELFATHNIRGPHLVVMPLSVISSWRNDISKFLCDERCANVLIYHGDKDERESALSEWWRESRREIRHKGKGKWKVALMLTTYEMIIKDVHLLKKLDGWQYLVVDEAQRLKNRSGMLFNALNKIPVQHRLLLTGTPLQNNLNELWSLLSFMLPKLFNDIEQFNEWFSKPFESGDEDADTNAVSPNRANKRNKRGLFASPSGSATTLVNGLSLSVSSLLSDSERNVIIASLHRAIKPFLLRRLKSEVAPDLPAKFERIVYCPLTDLQLALYKLFKELAEKKETLKLSQYADFDDTLTLELRRMVKPLTSFQNMIMQLRKLCNHPYLILEDMKTIPDDQYFSQLMSCSGKLIVLERLLSQLLSIGSKVLIFSQMTSALSIIESFLHQTGIEYFRLDGHTRQEDRRHYLSQFNSPQCHVSVFLLSTRAGGVGINLQAADTVILFDSDWNPQMDLQAISRTHRIGQSKKVLILRLISAGPDAAIHSIEQKILERAHRKLLASRAVLAEGVFDMGGCSGGNGSDVTTSSDCSSVQVESPIKNCNRNNSTSSSSSSINNVDESIYCLEDEFNDCYDESNIDNDPADWYIGLNHDSKTTMRSLFADDNSSNNTGNMSKNPLSQQSVLNLGDDHFLTLYDSMDFSREGIQQICRKQAVELTPVPPSALGDAYLPLDHNTMDSIGPIDVMWKSWLGSGVTYNEVKAAADETAKVAQLGKRKPRSSALYEARNNEKLQESELIALFGETEAGPVFKKRVNRKPVTPAVGGVQSPFNQRRQAEAASDLDEDYVDEGYQTGSSVATSPNPKRSQTGRAITAVTDIAGRIANDYVYGEELEQNCSLRNKCNRMPSTRQQEKDEVLYFESEDVCVVCGHAWVSDEGIAQYVADLQGADGDANVVDTVEDAKELMLICEGCEGSYHMICTGLKCVPEGNWYCQWCSEMQ